MDNLSWYSNSGPYTSFTPEDFGRLGRAVRQVRVSRERDFDDFYGDLGVKLAHAMAFEGGNINRSGGEGMITPDHIIPHLPAIAAELGWPEKTPLQILGNDDYLSVPISTDHMPLLGPWASPSVDLPAVTEEDAVRDQAQLREQKILSTIEDYLTAKKIIHDIGQISDDSAQAAQVSQRNLDVALCAAVTAL